LIVGGKKDAHCFARIRFIRFDWRMMNLHTALVRRLRGGNSLEFVLANAQVELRA
jgi:hypothetical protein